MQIIINIDEMGQASVETLPERTPTTHKREASLMPEGGIDIGGPPTELEQSERIDGPPELFTERQPSTDDQTEPVGRSAPPRPMEPTPPDLDEYGGEGFVDIGPPDQERLLGRKAEKLPGDPPGGPRISTKSHHFGLEEESRRS